MIVLGPIDVSRPRIGHAFQGPGWREALQEWAERLGGARLRVRTPAWGRSGRRVRRTRPLCLRGW